MDQLLRERLTEQLRAKKTALIVVDVQNDFCHSEGAFGKRGRDLSHVHASVDRLCVFMERCRELNLPIIFVRTIHSAWTDSASWKGRMEGAGNEMLICRSDSWGAELYKVKREEADFLVTKHRFSGFVGTDLDLVLRTQNVQTLLMTGVATNVCVETTARDGFNRDYRVVLVEDCCGAFTTAEHASAVRNIAGYFGAVTDSATMVSLLRETLT